jgi:CheY-like chemotaxis protein
MLGASLWKGHGFMDATLLWLGIGSGVGLLALWLGYRAFRHAEAKRRSIRAVAEAAHRAEAERLAEAKAARRRVRQAAAAQQTAAEAERARAVDEAANELARLEAHEAARLAAQATAAATAAKEADRLERERLAAELAAAQAAALASALAASANVATATVPKAPEQTLVMVADDSKIVRVKTGRLLAQHRYRVAFATDGLDAAQQIEAEMPDVVITDVDMPGMDGFELTRHVRQNPLTAHIPVIMITAADDKHRADADRAGVSVLLGKPYPEDELIARIRRAMGHVAVDGVLA